MRVLRNITKKKENNKESENMVAEKRGVDDAIKLDIEEITRDRIYADYALCNKDNYVDILEEIGGYLTQLDEEYLYSDNSVWVNFFKSKVVNWFGEEHGFAVIDEGYWLLSLASVAGEVKSWDMSRINMDDLESARKLVKLMGVLGEIGLSMSKERVI